MDKPEKVANDSTNNTNNKLKNVIEELEVMRTSGSSETMEINPYFNRSHVRSISIKQFEEDVEMVAAATMRSELDRLISISADDFGAGT